MKVIDQIVTDRYAVYHADAVEVAKSLPASSVDLVVTSIPFASLLCYSASDRDFGNSKTHAQFWEQMGYLLAEQRRVMRPGRIVAIHVMALPTSKERDGYIGLTDLPGDTIRAYQRHGFIYHSEVCIWKCPVTAVTRTKALGLLYKQLKKDSAISRQGIADKLIVMRTPGANDSPVTKDEQSFTVERWQRYASPVWATNEGFDDEGFARMSSRQIHGDDDSGIDQQDTLNAREAKHEDDTKHLCPLQLPVIRRSIKLWSNPGDTVWDPFGGVGSTGVVALEEGRKALLTELKDTYYGCAVKNLQAAANSAQMDLFDLAKEA